MTRIYLFPGQGSQKVGMGEGLFERFPEQVAIADAELGYSIAELCLRDPNGQLGQTQYTQPALFVVSALSYLAHLADTGELPQYLAGHSLGEYNALFAAGVFDFATGVKLVKQRALLMSRATGGAMAAVIGIGAEQIRTALAAAGLSGIDIANYNSLAQTVISGPESDVAASQAVIEAAGAKMFVRLAVSAAFHSRYMASAEQEFACFLEGFQFAEPRVPVYSNVTAALHQPSEIKSLLARQITHSVRWVETMEALLALPEPDFSELGPGNVLTGLVRRIKTELTGKAR